MATRPKGYLTKGKTKSFDAVRKSKARASFTPRGIASIVGNAVLDSPAGRVGKVAKTGVVLSRMLAKKAAAKESKDVAVKSAAGKRTYTRATTSTRSRTPGSTATKPKEKLNDKSKSNAPLSRKGAKGFKRTYPTAGKKIEIKEAGPVVRKSAPSKPAPKPIKPSEQKPRPGKVSRYQARKIAEESAGRKARSVAGNPNRTSSTGAIVATAPKPGVVITTTTSRGTKVTGGLKRTDYKEKSSGLTVKRKPPMTAKEIAENKIKSNVAAKTARSEKRTERPGRRATGKAIEGPKINPRTVNVAKPGKAKEANKVITAPRTRMGDPAKGDIPKQTESRRVGLRNAASDSRNTFKPTDRTPVERELEQVPDRIEIRRSGSSKEFDPQVAEAERRVSEGLRNRTGGEYELGKGKKPDMPNSRVVGERARQRPGIRKRRETSISESRTRANIAMNKKGLTPAEKRTLIMKSRAKARKIREGTK